MERILMNKGSENQAHKPFPFPRVNAQFIPRGFVSGIHTNTNISISIISTEAMEKGSIGFVFIRQSRGLQMQGLLTRLKEKTTKACKLGL